MRPADQTEYIVQCVREAASMYEDDARKFLAEHDAHVRAGALAEADLLPKADVVAWLTKKAREDTPVWLLASKVDRGAVRPDNLRMLPADFFEPGRTYAEPGDTTDWRFRCDSVTTHPEDGERTALGWRHFRGEWEPYAYGEDDFEIHLIVGHTDVTEAGEAS
jgi:hypothetical protein